MFKRLIRKYVKRAVRKQARKVSFKCGTCRKRYTNPATHTCVIKSDFKKRKADFKKRQAAAAKKAKGPKYKKMPCGHAHRTKEAYKRCPARRR